jgi:A118 family predicted phage portal protein
MQLALVGGECYIKPCPNGMGFSYTLIPRNHLLIFGRDSHGEPTDVGLMEKSTLGKYYYTLLERRSVDKHGVLTIRNRLFRSVSRENLGQETDLREHPQYRSLPKVWKSTVGSVGLVRMKTPMVNCVDGSMDAVAVFAPATQLIYAIDRNEAQLAGEFERGQSRVFLSRDLLDRDGNLSDNLFVGLDEDPQTVGMTVFAPQLREQSFLARKQEYLRNVESVVGLKRGMLSDVNMDERTATEIAASQADFSLTVMDFQAMWEEAVVKTMELCSLLAGIYGMGGGQKPQIRFDWGNGVLYDEEKLWQGYLQMVKEGLIAPEVALGWRFGMPADTEEQRLAIRQKYMPNGNATGV